MAKICSKQGCNSVTADRTMKFCPAHSKEHLIELEEAGYLEPLEYPTQNGTQKISSHRFLSIRRDGTPR